MSGRGGGDRCVRHEGEAADDESHRGELDENALHQLMVMVAVA